MGGGGLQAGTHLVCHDGAAGCTCVGRNHDAAVEKAADDGGSGAGRLRQRHALSVQGGIAVVVGEVEAGHGERGSNSGETQRSRRRTLKRLDESLGGLRGVAMVVEGWG